MPGRKQKKLENAQRSLVQNVFFIDKTSFPSDIESVIDDGLKKMKPLSTIWRAFKDFNHRHFTLNLNYLILFYTPTSMYNVQDITYLPLEELSEVRDKPHNAISNQGVEWKDAFGFTIQFNDRYVVLVAQDKDTYHKWMDHFEMIRWKSSGQSILKRERTQYRTPQCPGLLNLQTINSEYQDPKVQQKQIDSFKEQQAQMKEKPNLVKLSSNQKLREGFIGRVDLNEDKDKANHYLADIQKQMIIKEKERQSGDNLLSQKANLVTYQSIKIVSEGSKQDRKSFVKQLERQDGQQDAQILQKKDIVQEADDHEIKPKMFLQDFSSSIPSVHANTPIKSKPKIKFVQEDDSDFNEQEFLDQLLGIQKISSQKNSPNIVATQTSNLILYKQKVNSQVTHVQNTDDIQQKLQHNPQNQNEHGKYDDWDDL